MIISVCRTMRQALSLSLTLSTVAYLLLSFHVL